MLGCKGMSFRRGKRPILRDIGFTLEPGTMTGLLGANGAGKTTLLRLLLGLERPCQGAVTLEGRSIHALPPRELARRIAYVPQSHRPAFPYRVRDVVALGHKASLGFGPGAKGETLARVEDALARVHIAHLVDRPYTELSGGERQSVLLARALAQGTQVLILDEPATGLDFGQQRRMWRHLRALAQDGYTILCTTHDPIHARALFDRALLLHEGQLVGDGPPHKVLCDETITRVFRLDPDEELCAAANRAECP